MYLKMLLSAEDTQNLEEFYMALKVSENPDFESMDKSELIEKIDEFYKSNMTYILERCTLSSLKTLKKLVSEEAIDYETFDPGLVDDLARLNMIFLIHANSSNPSIDVPEDLVDIIKRSLTDKLLESTKYNEENTDVINGIIYYYGCLFESKFNEIFHTVTGRKIDVTDIIMNHTINDKDCAIISSVETDEQIIIFSQIADELGDMLLDDIEATFNKTIYNDALHYTLYSKEKYQSQGEDIVGYFISEVLKVYDVLEIDELGMMFDRIFVLYNLGKSFPEILDMISSDFDIKGNDLKNIGTVLKEYFSNIPKWELRGNTEK